MCDLSKNLAWPNSIKSGVVKIQLSPSDYHKMGGVNFLFKIPSPKKTKAARCYRNFFPNCDYMILYWFFLGKKVLGYIFLERVFNVMFKFKIQQQTF